MRCLLVSSEPEGITDIGKHNIENLKNGLGKFGGLPHRLEFVRQVGGVDYYNDTCATAPSATAAAIKSFNKVNCNEPP